jgi:ATP-dependent helicase HrpB
MLQPLPIDAHLPRILGILSGGHNLVLTAEPGAGKTTRVPRALLDAGLLEGGECWVLEPRRLAARLAAARVAEELGEELGQRAGYAVRFEQKTSKATRLRFVTEGLLLRRLQEDPQLTGIAWVILDEFHERHLHTDLALALLRRLQRGSRPELRLAVMSATLDAEPVAAFLEADSLCCEGRAHPVELRHLPRPDERPLALQVVAALETLLGEGTKGHTLVFLPGAAEIRACERALAPLALRHGLMLLPLHGSLSFEAQKAAVAPSQQPKVLLSTNVAESSVTIEGVTMVIDSGLGREAVHSPWSGLSGLRTMRISQARCVQRAGRAGRQGPGRCLRLFTEADFRMRAAFDVPEIRRSDLAEALLAVHGIAAPGQLDWFETPGAEALAVAEKLLERLGALAQGQLTQMGRRMAMLPLHPRLARLLVASDELDIPDLGRQAAALLETGELRARANLDARPREAGHGLASDLWARLDAYHEAEAAHFGLGALRAAGLDPASVRQARLTFEALRDRRARREEEPADAEERLLRALLFAYPDRLAKAGGTGTFALLGGGGARLDPGSRVRKANLIVALEAEEVRGTRNEVLIRMASKVEPEWLLEAFADQLRDEENLAFNPVKGVVERRGSLWLEDLCLEETRRAADPEDPRTAAVLAEAALAQGLGGAGQRVQELLDRTAFLARQRPDLELAPTETLRRDLVRKACQGCRTLKNLEAVDWTWVLKDLLGADHAALLEAWAPEVVLLRKRRVKVNYEGDAPWIESRLQDFLGVKEGPRIAKGAVPVVLHLLAPNNRALQVTTDLAGFWQRTYRDLRPALSRRYPKHLWPEDPLKFGS